jgi:predicted DNA-binding protein YlxM (UPF0122 family)
LIALQFGTFGQVRELAAIALDLSRLIGQLTLDIIKQFSPKGAMRVMPTKPIANFGKYLKAFALAIEDGLTVQEAFEKGQELFLVDFTTDLAAERSKTAAVANTLLHAATNLYDLAEHATNFEESRKAVSEQVDRLDEQLQKIEEKIAAGVSQNAEKLYEKEMKFLETSCQKERNYQTVNVERLN